MFCMVSSQIGEKHPRVVAVLLEIMMKICGNTAVCEHGFSCMNSEKSVLPTRLRENTLDHIMHINIDVPFLDNFDTSNSVSDWIDLPLTQDI